MSDLDELARLGAAVTPLDDAGVVKNLRGIAGAINALDGIIATTPRRYWMDQLRDAADLIERYSNAAPALLATAARQAELETEVAAQRRQIRHKTAYIRWQRWVHGKDHRRWADQDDEREEDINTLAAEVDVLAARQAEWKAMAERAVADIEAVSQRLHAHLNHPEVGIDGVTQMVLDDATATVEAFVVLAANDLRHHPAYSFNSALTPEQEAFADRALAAEEADSDTEGRAG